MAFTNPFSVKTPSQSTIGASEINACGAILEQCLDSTNGGVYTPLTPIDIGGAQGLRIPSGGVLTVLSGGTLSVPSGGIVTAASGSTVTLAGTNVISGVTTASDLTMTGTTRVKLASRSVTRSANALPTVVSGFAVNSVGTVSQTSTTSPYALWSFTPPHGSVLTGVSILITPNAGHGGTFASGKPALSVYAARTDSTAAPTSLVLADSGLGGNDPETLSLTLSETIDRTVKSYFIKLIGESGTDSLTGLVTAVPTYTLTMTEMAEA